MLCIITFAPAVLVVAFCILTGRAFAPIYVRPLLMPLDFPCRSRGDHLLHRSQYSAITSKQEKQIHMSPESQEALKTSTIRERIPMWLTYTRCIMIPLLVYVFYRPQSHVLAPVIFGAASFTDWLDGYLARRWKVESSFGAFLDPVVDKLMVSTTLILLSGRYGSFVAIPSAVVLAREIAVSALREWMASNNLRQVVKVGFQGKVKTALTMVALTVFLAVPNEAGSLFRTALALTYLSTVITVTSGSVYFQAAAPHLRSLR